MMEDQPLALCLKTKDAVVSTVKFKEEEVPVQIGPDGEDTIERNEDEDVSVRSTTQNIPLRMSPVIDPEVAIVTTEEEEEEEEGEKEKEHVIAVQIKEEGVLEPISASGGSSPNADEHAPSSPDGDTDDDITAESVRDATTPTSQPELSSTHLSSAPSLQVEHHTTVRHRIHKPKKPYSCKHCGRCFQHKSLLIRHERVHTGEKPYSCSECGKCFSMKYNVINHEKIHTGKKPFTCAQCGKCFSMKYSLIEHERIHTGEKPFSCSQCGKSFSMKCNLVGHERVHTGEKPFSCFHCGKGFSQKSGLSRHERIHTGEKPYYCLICGRCFSQKSNLNTHNKVHKEK